MINLSVLKTITLASTLGFLSQAQAIDPSAAMGQGLYEQQGSNSCSFCHGIDGKGGKVADAAKLNTPKAWKTFKALGGEAELKKNKTAFLKNMEEAIVDLIAKGAIAHNSTFKKPHHDFKKSGGPVNAQMLGLGGAPSAAWVNKFKERGVTKDIAARSAYLHIQSFDTQGVFK